jgi:CRISPR-associated endoribonuclease Cas6
MPVAFTMRLSADSPVQAETRHLHGLACALFEGEGSLHNGQDKPFAVWPVETGSPAPDHRLLWRASWLAPLPPPHRVESLGQVRLGAQPLRICAVDRREAGYGELAAGPVLRAITLAFRSPVFFSRNGTDDLSPDPRLILGSYRRRWNCLLGEQNLLAISDEEWRDTHRWVQLTGYELRTQAMDTGRGRTRTGFTGTATLYLDRTAPRSAETVFSALARFAPYCGTGAQTTHGFGATELIGSVLAATRQAHG